MTPEQVAKAREMMADPDVTRDWQIMDATGLGMKELFSLKWHLTAMSDAEAAEYYNAHLSCLQRAATIDEHFRARNAKGTK